MMMRFGLFSLFGLSPIVVLFLGFLGFPLIFANSFSLASDYRLGKSGKPAVLSVLALGMFVSSALRSPAPLPF